MNQQSLSRWIKAVVLCLGLFGAGVYILVIPLCGESLVGQNPGYAFAFWPWLIFLWCTAVPCYWALVIMWRVASRIGQDQSFSRENAASLKRISYLALGDMLFFFIGNLVLLFLNMSHPGVVIMAMVVELAGAAVAMAAAAVSHLVLKAALIKEENEEII